MPSHLHALPSYRPAADETLDTRCVLGESPLTMPGTGTLHWVDAGRGVLHTYRAGVRSEVRVTGGVLAAVVAGADGEPVLVVDRQIRLASGRIVAELPDDPAGVRCNDAKAGPDGRLWTGTVVPDTPGGGALWSVDAAGTTVRHWDGVSHGNGIAWDPLGETLYVVDSGPGTLSRAPFRDGDPGPPEVILTIPRAQGIPDGLTVDAGGDLWLAVWGGHCVLRLRPDGTPAGRIDLPERNVTSCAFHAGRLAVTTAADDVDPTAPGGAVHLLDLGRQGPPGHHFGERSAR
ncbi:SMP-30/gluconolactonase/LRE family protein [Dactylosporangium sp. NPDC050588]|uniref:SMP-30/gluconolactonase/LRE family protein n=1 Tax=Dactylosporangium sp. NPDC050588 TaxID=3157211 RepID=UPI0033FC04E6